MIKKEGSRERMTLLYAEQNMAKRGSCLCQLGAYLPYVPIALGFQAAYPKASPDSYDPSIEVSN
jgi:hypothetical protein